ncbi:MAG: hypothetical protein HYW50_03900 [Candidatus Diapherotrites archaeon]|nr:hypothetical protein [Candidatus Diapherotrites archaeon]
MAKKKSLKKKRISKKSLSKKPMKGLITKKIDEIVSDLSENRAEHSKGFNLLVEDLLHSGSAEKSGACDEEIAVGLAALYFREIARLGFKRSLEIDDVINAYFYALARLSRKDFESREIMEVIKRAKSY